jgi:hypothetical protein
VEPAIDSPGGDAVTVYEAGNDECGRGHV